MNVRPAMRIGFHSGALYRSHIGVAIDKVAAAGYDAIELNAEAPHRHVTPALSADERRLLRRRAAEAGLAISAVSAHVSLVDADPEARRANLDYALGCVEMASDVGTRVAHLISGKAAHGLAQQDAWGWLAEGAARCVERGEAVGVRVGFEAVVNQLVHDMDGLNRLTRAVAPLPLYANFDPSHYHVHGADPVAVVRALGPRIVHVHLKDARGAPEDFQFPPLGRGDVDLRGVATALAETGYGGVLSVEYEADDFGYHESEDAVIVGSLAFVRGLLGA
ncbi:MAG: sugar phosphate isomerase/epimerase [Chloroflexota bacterium]